MTLILLCSTFLANLAYGEEVINWALEDDDGGFSSGGDPGQWAWGAVNHGPEGGSDGANAWGTNLDTNYMHNSVDWLQLPSTDLSTTVRPILMFTHWYEFHASGDSADNGHLEVCYAPPCSDGEWESVEPVYGYPDGDGYQGESNGWTFDWFELTGLGNADQVRFVFESDSSGTAPGWYVDNVTISDGDTVPPSVGDVTEVEDSQALTGPFIIEADVTDDLMVETVELVWNIDGGETIQTEMTLSEDTIWSGELLEPETGVFFPDSLITWWIEASDGTSETRYPADEDLSFRVYLASPTNLTGPEERVIASQTEIAWTAPDSPWDVVGYAIERNGETVSETTGTDTEATVSLDGPIDEFVVSAWYDTPLGDQMGDPSDPVEIYASVPEILTLYPDEGYQGDTLRVTVAGEYLLMVADDVDLILGDGVEQTDAEIQDVDVGIFTIVIDETATAGSRDLELVSGPISVSIPDAFAVLDGEDRPAIVDLQPSEIRQGETIAVNITTSIPPESSENPWLQLDFGEGIIVQTISADTEITTITAEITAELTAPLGARNVEVDDGIRIMEGLQMTVIDQQLNPNSTCGCSARGPAHSHSKQPWIWFGMVGIMWFGRRRLRR